MRCRQLSGVKISRCSRRAEVLRVDSASAAQEWQQRCGCVRGLQAVEQCTEQQEVVLLRCIWLFGGAAWGVGALDAHHGDEGFRWRIRHRWSNL
jgi:hypothetical protein